MRRDVVDFVITFQTCQQVKYEPQKTSATFFRMLIQEWKWGRITMDFGLVF